MGKYSTPLKHLEVSRFIHAMRYRILALQQQEYGKETLAYLTQRQLTGKPFIDDFSKQPDQIIQIKQLSNALYLAEEVFDQLEKLDLSDQKSIYGIYTVREQAYEASCLLLKIGEKVEGAFKSEIATVASYLSQLVSLDLFNKPHDFEKQMLRATAHSQGLGNAAGRFVDQLKPAAGQLDYDLLTWVSSVLPTYIEAARRGIETSAAQTSLSLPRVDHKTLTRVLHTKTKKLSNSIQTIINTVNGIKDVKSLITHLPALFKLPSHFEQMQPLLMETLLEVDHLDETAQNLVREQLAKLKYEVFPNLFSMVDKLEMEMLLEPGRISRPLMNQIKPLYDLLIQTISRYPKFKFSDKAEQLLKLEDAEFMAHRLAPLREKARLSKQALHQINVASRALEEYLEANQDDLSEVPLASRQACFDLLHPYLALLDDEFKQVVETHLTTDSALPSKVKSWWSGWYPEPETHSALSGLHALHALLRQMRADHWFKLKRNRAHIKSVYATANMVLFEHKKTTSVFDLSEKDAFAHRYSLSDGIQFDGQGAIIDKKQLTPAEAWDLYQWYDDRVTNLSEAEADCDRLLALLKANQLRNEKAFKSNTIAFHLDSIPCLLEGNTVQHLINRLYVNIEGTSLKYEVLEPSKVPACGLLKTTQINPEKLNTMDLSSLMGHHDGFIQYGDNLFYFDHIRLHFLPPEHRTKLKPIMAALNDNVLETRDINSVGTEKQDFETIESENIRAVCKLYLMPLDEVKKAGYRNCYVWNREKKQLSYIDVHGQTQDNIVLSPENKGQLTLFIEKKIVCEKIEHWRMAEKDDPVVQIIALDLESPMRMATEESAKVRLVYVTTLDCVKRDGGKNCYVWDKDTQSLFFINDEGQDQPVNLDRYTRDIHQLIDSPDLTLKLDRIDLNLMLKHIEEEPTNNPLAKLVKLVDRKRRADKLGQSAVKPNTIETNDLNYRNLTAANIARFITTPVASSLLWMTTVPEETFLMSLSTPCYIRTDYGLFYYNKEKKTHQQLDLDAAQLAAFDDVFASKENVTELSTEQLQRIASITGHAPSTSGHSPGTIRKGSIPLSELGCSLTQLTSIKPLQPYLPRIFDKLLERGDILDPEHSECIRCYSAIQPYLVDAFKDIKIKDIRPFDRDVVNFFSGQVYKETSESLSFLSFEDFRPQLRGLKTELSVQKSRIQAKRKEYFERVQGRILEIEPCPIPSIHHPEFSPNVAEYMLSIDPVKRQINESSKTVFRVKLALDHLKKYCKNPHYVEALFCCPDKNLGNKHYPRFYAFILQLQRKLGAPSPEVPVTAKQLEQHLKQILFYEERAIERNQAIVESFNARTPRPTAPHDLSEVTAFMALAPEFKPCLMKHSSQLEPGELCLEKEGNQLAYQFLHYGKLLAGKIELEQLAPLSQLSDLTQLNKKTILHVLSIAYDQRKRALDGDNSLISFEEALELYQWYRAIPDENKLGKYEKLAEKTLPDFKPAPTLLTKKSDTHQDRSKYSIKHARCSAALASLNQSIAEQLKLMRASFQQELKPALSGIPFRDVSQKNPVTMWALRLSPWLNKYTEGGVIPLLGYIVSLIEAGVSGVNMVAPSLQKSEIYPQGPHQVLAYKRLMNIAYFLEQIVLEIEKVNDDESKVSRVNHLLISYLYAADIYPLVTALSTDQHFAPFFRDMASKIDSVIQQITDEAEHYSVPEHEKKEAHSVENLSALYFMNVLKMLPERISLEDKAYHDKLPALQASATAAMVNIETIIHDYSASFGYVRLVLDLPIILDLLNELPKNITQFAQKINQRIKTDLNEAPPEFFLKAIVEADAWEMTFGLKPGTISDPLKKILDEFYKALITPLILDADEQVRLLCDPAPMKRRVLQLQPQLSASSDLERYKKASDDLQKVLNACDESSDRLPILDSDVLQHFKQALNGSHLYVMSIHDAKTAGYKDCFVWDDQRPQLFYIDSQGSAVDQIVHLKSTYKMVEFIAHHPHREQAARSPIYLSESELQHMVLSNSHFVLKKHGVSQPNAVGCCVITLSTVPEKFEDLSLPLNYNAYYVQVKGVNDALYYIDRKSKVITKLNVTPQESASFERKMSKVRKNNLMIHSDFKIIERLTKRIYQPDFISSLDDFKPNKDNMSLLKALATECKDHYERLHATAILATNIAKEQLDHLQIIIDAEQKSNLAIKSSVFKTHFNTQVDALCKDSGELQGYTLHLLTEDLVDIKPNHLYVAINGSRLDYQVIDPIGVEQKGSFELSDIGCPLKELVSADQLSSYLPAILKITSRRGDRHTRPHSLATEYQEKLRKALRDDFEPIFDEAMNSDSKSKERTLKEVKKAFNEKRARAAATRSPSSTEPRPSSGETLTEASALPKPLQAESPPIMSNSKAIDRLLNEAKEAFNQKHLESYRQLNAVNKALDDFMVYLNTAEQEWLTRHSLFESDATIRRKRSTIDHLDELASNESEDPSVRIKEIKIYLKEEATLEHLMSFATYESNTFAKVFQLVLRFFEAVGLYTPQVVQRVDKLLRAMEDPTLNQVRRSRVLFFSESTRNLIRQRGNALDTGDEPAADHVPPAKKPGI